MPADLTDPRSSPRPPQRPPERIDVPDRVRGRAGLSTRQRETARALAETQFTTEAGPPNAERLAWLVDDLDDFFAQAGDRAKFGFALCLVAISLLAPLLVLRLPPFRALSFERRAEALERFERSAFALAIFGAKAVLCILWYEHPASRAEIGHEGACLGGRERKLEVVR